MNRIRKKHFDNIVMTRGSRPQALITLEKRYALRLIIVSRLDLAIEATRESLKVHQDFMSMLK